MGSRPPHGVPVSSVVCQGLCLGAAALRPHRGPPRSWFSQTCLQPWPEDPVPRAFRPSSLSSVAEGATGVLLKRPEMEGACAHVCTCVRAHECVHSSVHPCASYRIPLQGGYQQQQVFTCIPGVGTPLFLPKRREGLLLLPKLPSGPVSPGLECGHPLHPHRGAADLWEEKLREAEGPCAALRHPLSASAGGPGKEAAMHVCFWPGAPAAPNQPAHSPGVL